MAVSVVLFSETSESGSSGTVVVGGNKNIRQSLGAGTRAGAKYIKTISFTNQGWS